MRRSVGLAVVVLMSSMSLGACYMGPAPVQYAALAMIGDRPTAVVATCGKSSVGVDVFQDDNTMDGELRIWSVKVTLPKPVREIEVEFFGAARRGWEITSTRSDPVVHSIPLTGIEPGHHYRLDSSESGPEGSIAPSALFSEVDFATIGADQVLAPVDLQHSKVISREAFVKERCG